MGLGSALEKMTDYVTGSKDPQLLTAVMEVQRELIAIQEENRVLRQKIIDLENDKIADGELTFRNGVYEKGNDVYCSVCWDRDRKLVRVRKVQKTADGFTSYSCDVCKAWRLSDIPWE